MKKELFTSKVRLFLSILSFGVFCFTHSTSYAYLVVQKTQIQTFVEFRGVITDSKTNDPLVFANLNVTDTNISTVTNSEGQFLIKIPNDLLDRDLIISFLGYQTKTVKINELSNESLIITLNESITQLSEVNIKAPKDAKTLVELTLNQKNENYYNFNAVMTAFYRETIKKRRRNASLSEAVMEVYKQPYESSKVDAIKLVKARKSTDYTRLDTLALKLQGGPFSSLYVDIIKYPEFLFEDNKLINYQFAFDKSTEVNGSLVYVVNFKPLPEIDYPLYYGKLYIDANTYALTSAIYNLNVENKELASEMFVRKKPRKVDVYPTEAAFRVDYRVKDGKWYFGYSNIQLTFKVDWEGKLFNSLYTLNSEMAITDWEENLTGVTRPSKSLRPTVILSEEASGFSDPNFWGKYNIIEPEKSIESAIAKIQKQIKRKQ